MALSSTHRFEALAGAPRVAVAPIHLGHAAHAHAPPRPSEHLRVVLAVPAHADAQYEMLAVMPNETIQGIKLRLQNRGWYSSKSTLVFGDRELADAVRVSDLVKASGKAHPSYLHVFVKLSDVESVSVRTLMRELSLANPAASEPQLAASLVPSASSGNLLALPAVSEPEPAAAEPEAGAPPPAAAPADGASHGRTVVHLMVHKSAKVNWRHMQQDKFELSISSSETVDELMRKIEAANGIALEPGAVLVDGQPLASGQPLAAYGIGKGSVLELVPHEPASGSWDDEALPDGSPSLASPAHQLHRHWQAARAGLAEGLAPTLAKAGTGGSYFLQDVAGRNVAVFKPLDEEPCAPNNPKGRAAGSSGDGSSGSPGSQGLRRGTRPGEGAVREVAAYVLDHEGFSGVPPTALVSAYGSGNASERKTGSLQQFVEAEGDCEEFGYSAFPVHEVHKVAVLDLRLANADRNAGNILVRRSAATGQVELVPIDHGYCLPDSFEDLTFEWAYWPQAEQPFSEATLRYIAALDAERDLALLSAHGIALRPECERVMRVSTLVLKKAAAAGLTAAQIAGIMCRDGLTRSVVEKLHGNAVALARAAGGPAAAAAAGGRAPELRAYLAHMERLLDEYLEEHLLEGADLMY